MITWISNSINFFIIPKNTNPQCFFPFSPLRVGNDETAYFPRTFDTIRKTELISKFRIYSLNKVKVSKNLFQSIISLLNSYMLEHSAKAVGIWQVIFLLKISCKILYILFLPYSCHLDLCKLHEKRSNILIP